MVHRHDIGDLTPSAFGKKAFIHEIEQWGRLFCWMTMVLGFCWGFNDFVPYLEYCWMVTITLALIASFSVDLKIFSIHDSKLHHLLFHSIRFGTTMVLVCLASLIISCVCDKREGELIIQETSLYRESFSKNMAWKSRYAHWDKIYMFFVIQCATAAAARSNLVGIQLFITFSNMVYNSLFQF